jgi:stress response protein SCP2
MFDIDGNWIEDVYYGKKESQDSSVKHNGDNLTGFGSGDDETIDIDLSKVSPKVHSIWPVITIYTSG